MTSLPATTPALPLRRWILDLVSAALLVVCGLAVIAIAKALDRRGRHASDIMRRP